MSLYQVQFQVTYQVQVDTDEVHNYPDSAVQNAAAGRPTAEAMVLFDAENLDEPIDTWADQLTVTVTGARRLEGGGA